MATQPNIELDEDDRPRPALPLAPPRRWTPDIKPGVVTSPEEVPRGAVFGTPGPDTGWALRIIRLVEGDVPGPLRTLLAALMGARAAAAGRAPTAEDLAAAKILCGVGEGLPEYLVERRHRWLAALRHERRKGGLALAEVGDDLFLPPDDLRRAVTLRRPGA